MNNFVSFLYRNRSTVNSCIESGVVNAIQPMDNLDSSFKNKLVVYKSDKQHSMEPSYNCMPHQITNLSSAIDVICQVNEQDGMRFPGRGKMDDGGK